MGKTLRKLKLEPSASLLDSAVGIIALGLSLAAAPPKMFLMRLLFGDTFAIVAFLSRRY